MSTPNGHAQRYRIIIRGDCTWLLAGFLDDFQAHVEPYREGGTCVIAWTQDDPEFWGLLEQLRDLALHVVSLQELGHGDGLTRREMAADVGHPQIP